LGRGRHPHDAAPAHAPALPGRLIEPGCSVVFESDLVKMGLFRARPTDPHFETAAQPETRDFVVFPRTRIQIRHETGGTFVVDGFMAALYNRGDGIRRRALSPEGDRCEWLGLDRRLLLETVEELDPWIRDQPARPFRSTHAPTRPETYLLQRQLFHAACAAEVDPLEVEERAVDVVRRLVQDAYNAWPSRRSFNPAPVSPRQKELVEGARSVLAARYRDPLQLGNVAGMLGVAHARLCRVFRHHTGLTLHAFREQLRHQHALEALASSSVDLTELALDLGYSSHSHFTASFRRAFGVTPSEIRRRLTSGDRGATAAVNAATARTLARP
jgi:AraC-like DNA-binding protein